MYNNCIIGIIINGDFIAEPLSITIDLKCGSKHIHSLNLFGFSQRNGSIYKAIIWLRHVQISWLIANEIFKDSSSMGCHYSGIKSREFEQ